MIATIVAKGAARATTVSALERNAPIQGDIQPDASAGDESQERRELVVERIAEREHDPHASGDAEEQKQQRADARRDRRSRIGVVHARVNAEHRGKGVHHRDAAQQKNTTFSVEIASANHKIGTQRDRQQDHFLGVVKCAAQLAEDDLFRRQVGDQQQIECPAIALVRQRRDGQRVEQDQADDQQRNNRLGGGRNCRVGRRLCRELEQRARRRRR